MRIISSFAPRGKSKGFIFSIVKSLPLFLWVICITTIISIIGFIVFSIVPTSVDYIALVPEKVLHGENLWAVITHIFFHADIFHLFVNMFSLFFIGSACESFIGKKRFLRFYLTAGMFGGIFFVLSAYLGSMIGFTQVFGDVKLAGIGASGALFGLLGILAVLIPKKRVYLIAGPIILIVLEVLFSRTLSGTLLTLFEIVVNFLFVIMIISLFIQSTFLRRLALHIEMPLWIAPIAAIVPLVLISFYVPLPIGNSAHFGGLVAGLVYGLYLRLKYPRKLALLEKYIR